VWGSALSISRSPFSAVPGAAPTVPVGANPVPLAADPVTHTIYVGNGDDTVSVINDASCNANNPSGRRGAVVATFNPGALGLTLADDQANHTLYVGQTDTVALISTKTCNASNPSGCGEPAASAPVGNFPGLAAVDPATSTIYVPNINDGRPR
jgi:DNA-binding beta-propeller fold protein YncE